MMFLQPLGEAGILLKGDPGRLGGTVQGAWFHQDDVFKGKPYRQRVLDPNGKVLRKTTNMWADAGLFPGVHCPYLKQIDEYVHER